MKKVYLLLILSYCGILIINAQPKNEFQIGMVLPTGNFADDDVVKGFTKGSGVAATGFQFGYKLLLPLKTEGLYWTLGAGIVYNDLIDEFKDDVVESNKRVLDLSDYHFTKYINVPFLAGVQFEKPMSEEFKLYCEAGIGMNILKMTNNFFSGIDAHNYKREITIVYKPSVNLGYKIGTGLILQNKYTIGLTYMNLGSHRVKTEIKDVATYNGGSNTDSTTDNEDGKFDKALPVSTFNVSFGIRFGNM